MLTLLILSFSFVKGVSANYKATVLNPPNVKCDLYSGSLANTGYCYYKDTDLKSIVNIIYWLDTGDEVEVITNSDNEPVTTPKKDDNDTCSDYYVYTKFNFKNEDYYGYYCNANLTVSKLTDELKKEFEEAGFPESYFEKLAILKYAHPNWSFKAINTGLKFSEAVQSEMYGSRSLLRRSMSNNYAFLSLDSDSFDYINDRYIPYDDISGSNPWYKANYDTIAYYMDPRNFLSDVYIFQFETLSYNDSIDDDNYKKSIASIFGDDYLNNFVENFLNAGKQSKVNPIYLASLSKEEVANGEIPGTAISGTFNGKYNFYNIGATSGDNPVYRGLDFASNNDPLTLRPWDSEEKAITGGAIWIYNNYVATGQDTSYFKKFDVVYNYLKSIGINPTHNNYTHQYMQNIFAPSSEATTTYRSYYVTAMLDLNYSFYIPVYDSMPEETHLPSKTGWPNNYLKSLSINNNNIAEFNSEVETYNYNLDINNPTLVIDATSISPKATIDGTGTFEITENTIIEIKVTAQNGDVKTYKINVNLTGTKLEEPKDIQTTLNNSGIKNSDKYLSGFIVGSDIGIIKQKILTANKEAIVLLKDSSSNIKENGVVATGDKVEITVGSETKEYEVVIYGDVNGDGKIAATDYVKIKNSIMGTNQLSGVYSEAADVDRNGFVKATDYVKIKNNIMGIGEITQ